MLCCFLKFFAIIFIIYIYLLHYRGFKKFALRNYYSSTTSSRRVGSGHMRVVCRRRQLRRIASRVLWRSWCILPWRHPFIRHIKTLSNKINRFRKHKLSPYYCSNTFIFLTCSHLKKSFVLTLASAKDVILWFGENPCRAANVE